jgi:hypothetical protein
LKYQGSETDIQTLFDTIGMSPAMLINLVNSVPEDLTLDEFMDNCLESKGEDLRHSPHQLLLVALKISPDGVKEANLKNVLDCRVDLSNPRRVRLSMKTSSNPLTFEYVENTFKLMSGAERTALLLYDFEKPK